MAQRTNYDNDELWNTPSIAKTYRKTRELFPAEQSILQAIGSRLETAAVLDIGVGAGRTTWHLAERCRSYVGVDYSQAMLNWAAQLCPSADLRLADARDLRQFTDQSFDLAIFSFNGLDYVGHLDRLKILGEVRRVLKDGGLFAFSSHRLGASVPRPTALQNLRPSRSPLRTAKTIIRYFQGIHYSRRAIQQLEEINGSYALLNDPAHEYRLLTYYVSPKQQLRQLNDAGFLLDSAFRMSGAPVAAAELTTADYGTDFMLHYLAVAEPMQRSALALRLVHGGA